MVTHWVRLLSVVFLSLVSTSSFGVHTDYLFKDEAEARAAPVWECGYVDAGLWYSIPGGAMTMEDCMALAPENALKKVIELGAVYSAKTPPGTRYCQPPPVRDDSCAKSLRTTVPDPVTGLPVGVYLLSCYVRQTLQCIETFAGGVGIAGGAQMHAGVIGIKGHPNPFQRAEVYLLADVSPPIADKCPIDPPIGPGTDACSLSLEAGGGKDVNGVCKCAEVVADPAGAPCLADKLRLSGIPYSGPTSTVRTPSYQAHLADVLKKYFEHQWLITDPASYELCTANRAAAKLEYDKHGIDYPPVGESHNNGTAFDIPVAAADILKKRGGKKYVRLLLNDLPPCNLKWGGDWYNPDKVHFQSSNPGQLRYCP